MPVTSEQMVEALLQPQAYQGPVQGIELKETHISWLFLTGKHVYKVKKPVDFGFLDFTTLEKRKYYCEQELYLNRRISPNTYLEVTPVTMQEGTTKIGEPGEVIDYAVKMVQLDARRALEYLLKANQVSVADMRAITRLVADFHRRSETSPEITRAGGWDTVGANWRENFEQTEKYIGDLISIEDFQELRAYVTAFLDTRRGWFQQRASRGMVRDCHGDLHAAQIFLQDGVQVIDCIEFNQRFRYSDVGLDVAFLAMDLDYREHPELSDAFIRAYLEFAEGDSLLEGLNFYKAYRAYVRGKVTAFRLEDPHTSDEEREQASQTARGYFRLARSCASLPARTRLFIFSGLMGTGKSTLAQELSHCWELDYHSSDETRKSLAGLPPTAQSQDAYGQGIYSGDWTQATYDALLEAARSSLQNGRSVILDASFRSREHRQAVIALARQEGAESWIIECVLDDETARERLQERTRAGNTVSEGRWELYQQQKAQWEPVTPEASVNYIRLDTSGSLAANLESLIYQMHRHTLEAGIPLPLRI